ncbi:MAG: transcriptional repressor [Calditrichaeota bacterium]|nr:transcriptional repressor [Calditrichota bacterium]
MSEKEMSVEIFVEACRRKGLNVTYQRILIFKSLQRLKTHPSAEEIFRDVRNEYPAISLATVYKTLETLSSEGLISVVNPLNDQARYDGNTSDHHHLVCGSCRKVVDIPHEFSPPIRLPEMAGHRVSGYRLLFEGICSDCRAEEPPRTAPSETFCGKG